MVNWTTFNAKALNIARTNWFLIALGVSIILAAIWPDFGKKDGIIRAEITISFVAVGLLFFVTGLNMKTSKMVESFLYYKLIILVQLLSFVVEPAIGFAASALLKLSNFDASLASGIIIASCCPTTVSSNVVLTIAANGNEAATLANSVIGNTIGIFISPLLMIWLLGTAGGDGTVNYLKIFGNLGIIVVGPLVLGQITRFSLPKLLEVAKKYVNLAFFNSCCLLLIIYGVFCDTFSSGAFSTINGWLFLLVLFICLLLLLLYSAISFFPSRIAVFNFSKQDSISILYSGSQKTVALGIPLIKVLFEGRSDIGLLSIPILVYHAEQLVFGAVLVPYLLKWCPRNEENLSSISLDSVNANSRANLVSAPETESGSTVIIQH